MPPSSYVFNSSSLRVVLLRIAYFEKTYDSQNLRGFETLTAQSLIVGLELVLRGVFSYISHYRYAVNLSAVLAIWKIRLFSNVSFRYTENQSQIDFNIASQALLLAMQIYCRR